jgi:hypothetical protein
MEAASTLKCQSTSMRLYGSVSQNALIFIWKIHLSTTSHLLHSVPHGHLTRGFLTEFCMLSLYSHHCNNSVSIPHNLVCWFYAVYSVYHTLSNLSTSSVTHPVFQYCSSSPEVPKLWGMLTQGGTVGLLGWHELFLWGTYLFWANMGTW